MPETNVHWLEWSEEAFRRARAEDKPVLLFIDATWSRAARAMDRECFSEPAMAELVDREYVPVRVDTDRRPDINDRYGAGGCPTLAFLTPKGELLWGTGYLPPGEMKQILVQLKVGFVSQRGIIDEEIRKRDEKIAQAKTAIYTQPATPSVEIFRKTVRGIILTFDPNWGGFGREPKWPLPASLEVLLVAYADTGGPDIREVLEETLRAMGEGGVYDAPDGGFFRCAQKENWSSPLFEKLGDENAELLRVYLEASTLLTGQGCRRVIDQTLEWWQTTLCDRAEGRFFASQDADEAYYGLTAEKRRARARPSVDRTAFSGVTSATVSALLRASAILNQPEWGELALRALENLLRECFDAKRGMAHYAGGISGLARDQALVSRALVDAYEFSGRTAYLEPAHALLGFCRERLWSEEEGGGLMDRPPGHEELGELARRRKNVAENAIAAETAVRLSYQGDESLRAFAERILRSFPDFLDDYGHYTAEYALACDALVRPALEIDLEGATPEMRRAAFAAFVPRRVIRHGAGSKCSATLRRGSTTRSVATAEELGAALKEGL